MRESLRKTLLWQAFGLLCYLAGLGLFLVVVVTAYFEPPENSLANLTTAHMAAILLSIALLVMGRTISWRVGDEWGVISGSTGTVGDAGPPDSPRDRDPVESKLEELGYNVPREQPSSSAGGITYEDGRVRIRCAECGATNKQSYTHCRDCSSELPD